MYIIFINYYQLIKIVNYKHKKNRIITIDIRIMKELPSTYYIR